ncbi:hypothetical protein DFH07DRAFT_805927 [Mycena maculata]|uniref:J domain-containing protein n=1 Tax=Mycena maculata TaxID=230809 RepID=A0AAD7JR89_9AGAR|nr:hypothetical protein DFH07DRAFT_805927 [Mycena maculata]
MRPSEAGWMGFIWARDDGRNHASPHALTTVNTIEMANIRSQTSMPLHRRPDANLDPQWDSRIPGQPDHRMARSASRGPWKHMADTYAWVENHCTSLDSRGKKTEKWVLEQQIFYPYSTPPVPRKVLDDMIFIYEDEPEGWMRDEGRVGWREKEKKRMLEQELERIENRIRHRREMERRRLAAERWRSSAEIKRLEKDQRAKADQAIRDSWRAHEKGWEELRLKSAGQVTFSDIPWPMASTPKTWEELEPREIRDFLLSPLHSETQSAKERIRKAQLRWHPDRFRWILGKAKGADKSTIEDGAGVVARCLNDMM